MIEEYVGNKLQKECFELISQRSRKSLKSQKSQAGSEKKLNSDLTSIEDLPAKFTSKKEDKKVSVVEDPYQNETMQAIDLQLNKAFVDHEMQLMNEL